MDSWTKRCGERLRMLRRIRGLKQSDVCADVGMLQSALSRYENGMAEVPLREAVRMARLYRCPLAMLDGDTPMGDLDRLFDP
jgi:transcriptional regulator with XRE-family HTH domain